jgi:hypothetical protein
MAEGEWLMVDGGRNSSFTSKVSSYSDFLSNTPEGSSPINHSPLTIASAAAHFASFDAPNGQYFPLFPLFLLPRFRPACYS